MNGCAPGLALIERLIRQLGNGLFEKESREQE